MGPSSRPETGKMSKLMWGIPQVWSRIPAWGPGAGRALVIVSSNLTGPTKIIVFSPRKAQNQLFWSREILFVTPQRATENGRWLSHGDIDILRGHRIHSHLCGILFPDSILFLITASSKTPATTTNDTLAAPNGNSGTSVVG